MACSKCDTELVDGNYYSARVYKVDSFPVEKPRRVEGRIVMVDDVDFKAEVAIESIMLCDKCFEYLKKWLGKNEV